MSLLRKFVGYFSPAPDSLARFRELPAKLLRDFDILANDQGLHATILTGLPITATGQPIPWFTYPAVEYLSQFDVEGKNVFEYGSGHSTLYWSRRGAKVWAVDHDKDWFETMLASLPQGQTLYFASEEQDYANTIRRPAALFDIVVIDGAFREACVEPAIAHLRPGGFIIFDNAERDMKAAEMLRQRGMFEVDFSGFGPINDYTWTTAIFLPPGGVSGFSFSPPHPVGGNFA